MPGELRAIFEAIKNLTIYQVFIAITSAASILTPLYILAKPVAVSAAGTAIENILVAQGIDPKSFKDVPKKVEEQGKRIEGLSDAQTRIESDLATVKDQQKQIIDILTKDNAQPGQ